LKKYIGPMPTYCAAIRATFDFSTKSVTFFPVHRLQQFWFSASFSLEPGWLGTANYPVTG